MSAPLLAPSRLAAAPSPLSLLGEHWAPSWAPSALIAAALALYLAAFWSLRARARPRRWPLARGCSFAAGVLVVAVALQSGVGAYDDRLLSAHMVQHLLLVLVAPPLVLGGRPLILALRALAPARRLALLALFAPVRRLASAPACLALFTAGLLLVHLPAAFDAAIAHPQLHLAEHALLFALGLLYWWPLLGEDPSPRRRLGGLGRVLYLLASMPAMALLGAYLNRAAALVYPAYARPARALGISAVADQQQAGAIMWVAGSSFVIAIGLTLAMRALVAEERRLAQRELHGGELRATGESLAGHDQLAPGVPLAGPSR